MVRRRNTVQKAAVLAAVKGAKHHPDAKWVYRQVSREIPDISLGTVYRALALLSSEGLIREYRQVDGPSLYDPNAEEHFHIRCTQCGRIQDVPPVELPGEMLERVLQASDFLSVEQIRLEFGGVCADCAEEAQQTRK